MKHLPILYFPMDADTIILLFCSFVLLLVPLYFIYNSVYKDGVIGRASLGAISIAAYVLVHGIVVDALVYEVSPEIILLIVSFTVFLSWHLYRFRQRMMHGERRSTTDKERRTTPRRTAS